MFGWFRSKPTCPVTAEEKSWIEERFTWLIDEFGMQRLTKGTFILPTAEFFPDDYDLTHGSIRSLMNRVAEYMDVDPVDLRLRFYEEARPEFEGMMTEGSAGLYGKVGNKHEIWLELNTLEDPLRAVATLAHEIGHVLLLGERRISPDEEDHEMLTDLITVYMGMGLFPANMVMQENYWDDGPLSGWSMSRQGYLSMNMFGYAFALYAIARGELSPKWLSQLRLDVRTACKQGMHYVNETGDCSCPFVTPR
ncbi:hypothetical protein [Gimesia chilikensis]|uniref:Uncharacterized protein n=1 Tax=Gimesia chilikensis TaxID=2605989 RepID=A0A517PY53_9PLAN|nr:hypothetical protein [Gimesia chilikensis]QDT24306.1 hypothetical protein HG66A1_61380 [Gimesia chilikensis]